MADPRPAGAAPATAIPGSATSAATATSAAASAASATAASAAASAAVALPAPAAEPPAAPAAAAGGASAVPGAGGQVLRGLGVSPGAAAGPVLRMAPPPRLPDPVPVTDAAAETAAAAAALAKVAADLGERARAARDAGDTTAADVLSAQVMMVEDPTIADAVASHVAAGADAAHAVDAAFAAHREAFAAAGGYLAERVADLDDLRDRAVAALLGQPPPGVPAPGHPFVLVAEDLAPADTATLATSQVLALVTERGGPTSHTAILARGLGLPAVVSCPGARSIPEGTLVWVDGSAGEVHLAVDPAVADEVRREAALRAERLAASRGPGRTADGHPVSLLLNIGSADDLRGSDVDHEGVGLFRTEFLFLHRREPPSADEQRAAYAEAFRAAGGRKVVLRTLDAGADKPLPFLGMPPEENPALGVRGLRVARTRPEVLDAQLAAIAAAAADTGADVWVMAPMVSTPGEAAGFAAQARAHGLPVVGAMVEVPAAALRARELLRAVDFLSIGTNDLSQYTLAADRLSGALADLLDPWQPALLRLVADCAAAGREAGRPVGVCGEAAADPLLALVLTGLGVTSLSMSAPALAEVRLTLAAHTLADCRRLADLALAAQDPQAGRAAVRAALATTGAR